MVTEGIGDALEKKLETIRRTSLYNQHRRLSSGTLDCLRPVLQQIATQFTEWHRRADKARRPSQAGGTLRRKRDVCPPTDKSFGFRFRSWTDISGIAAWMSSVPVN